MAATYHGFAAVSPPPLYLHQTTTVTRRNIGTATDTIINDNRINQNDIRAFASILASDGDGDDGTSNSHADSGRILTNLRGWQSEKLEGDAADVIRASCEVDELNAYTVDWTRRFGRRLVDGDDDVSVGVEERRPAVVVLQPASVDQVSRLLQHCSERNLPVVPQGGNTSLVGGSVPNGTITLAGASSSADTVSNSGNCNNDVTDDVVILSMERMNRIESFNEEDGIVSCQSGCILQTLQDYVASEGHLFPIDLGGASGSCQIGGNVSTNAGGIYYYRYGSVAANLLGLTVVLADGTVLRLGGGDRAGESGSGGDEMMTCSRKDNTGYKLHQLFVGSEGTLGVITNVTMQCPPLPRSKQSALLLVRGDGEKNMDYHGNVMQLMKAAKRELGEILAALEWMDRTVVRVLSQNYDFPIELPPHERQEGNDEEDGYALVLLETHGTSEDYDAERLETFLESVLESGVVSDGVVAQDMKQQAEFWKLREACGPEMLQTGGCIYKYDLSLPTSDFAEFIGEIEDHLRQSCDDGTGFVSGHWGHLLDGNLHFNVTTPERDVSFLRLLEPTIYETTIRRGGSISAEHGIGQSKSKYMEKIHGTATVEQMRAIKKLFDPKGILNPGKVL